MPNYQYVAQNEDGKSLKGILRSDNERAARQEIKSKKTEINEDIISYFHEKNINLTKIESRPYLGTDRNKINTAFSYIFYTLFSFYHV